jgi:hypothetical protein
MYLRRMEAWEMWGKLNEHGKQVDKWLKHEKNIFHPIGPLNFVHLPLIMFFYQSLDSGIN